jgi:hypothetical protein
VLLEDAHFQEVVQLVDALQNVLAALHLYQNEGFNYRCHSNLDFEEVHDCQGSFALETLGIFTVETEILQISQEEECFITPLIRISLVV